MEKREMGGLLKKMGFNRRTIKNYLSGQYSPNNLKPSE